MYEFLTMNLNIVIKILVKVFFFLYNYIRKVDDYMNKKGFTLVELLAVIIILSLLALIASTSVTKVVRDSKTDLYNTQIELIKAAAEAWGADNLYKLPEANTCKFMTLYDLKSYGLIDPDITNPKTGELFSDDMIIKITGELNKYGNTNVVYEIDAGNIGACESVYPKICTLVDDADKSGTVTIGDKYQCKVKNDMETGFENGYYFYVLSFNEEDASTNLIMDRNMCEDGTVATEENTCLVAYNLTGEVAGVGPVTAMTYLNNATDSWSNIPNLNTVYDDEGGNFTGFALNGKSRLPYKKEINNFNNNNGYLFENLDGEYWNYDESTKPTKNISNIFGYWSLSTFVDESTYSWYVDYSGNVGLEINDSVDIVDNHGVRPVITIPNFNMS